MFCRDPVGDFAVKEIKDMPNLCVTAGNKKGQESVTAMIGGILGFRGRAQGLAAVPADSLTLLDPFERRKTLFLMPITEFCSSLSDVRVVNEIIDGVCLCRCF